ncbi:MAG TPA: protein translocase subunit SecF [Allosphingosinicella sp.]|nr:protein translocase subunit SecF [Allosphingosinicella sp.]
MRLLKLVPDDTNVDFLRWRNVALIISTLLIAASIALLWTKGLNYGVDFKGGQMSRVVFQQPPNLDELRSRIGSLNLGEAGVQEAGSNRTLIIRTPLPEGGEDAANRAAATVRQAVTERYPGARFVAVDTVSGKVSGELLRAGALALLLAAIGISLYIWIRFEWQFGVGALFSLFHDVTVTMGLLALTQLEFNLNVIAALLTLIGYSLNDTIVVYDRVRENLRKYRKMEMAALLNLSANETLSRTVATNVAMMLALGALFLLGPDVIYSFTVTLFFSVVIGTYSTVYIAAPWLVWLKVKSDSFLPKAAPMTAAERLGTKPRNEGGDGARV